MPHSEPRAEGMAVTVSRAANVPQELFKNVLRQATESEREWIPSKSNYIRDICALSLVSAYFATICRPYIFGNLRLRNRQHMCGLLALTGASPTVHPSMAAHMHYIIIDSDSSDDHWVHQVAMAFLPWVAEHSSRMPVVRLCLSNRDENIPRRSVARLTSRHVTELVLSDISFSRGEDLLRFLAAFPAVHDVDLYSITCKTTIQDPSEILAIPYVTSLQLASVDCSICRQWIAAWMLGGCSDHGATFMSQWNASDIANFSAIVAILPTDKGVNLSMFPDKCERDIVTSTLNSTHLTFSPETIPIARELCSIHIAIFAP